MSFLSAYDGVTRYPVGDDSRGYWIELKNHVSTGAREDAERALSTTTVIDGAPVIRPDITRYRQLMVLASISAWNLDEEDGTIWPVSLRSVQRLPGEIFDKLWVDVDRGLVGRSSAEQQQFRDGDGGSDQDGNGGSTVAVDVPA